MSQIISIEGNIGSGKSTILQHLKECFKTTENIIFLEEPVDIWETIKDENGTTILTKFYENQEKYSFAFQMMAYISRLSILKNTIKENPNAIIITERCLNTDRYVFAKMLYDNKKIEEIEYQIYLKWFDEFCDIIQNSKMIYMKTNPEICYERIAKRNRTGESNISIDYLNGCHHYHEEMIKKINYSILEINSNIDTDINKDIINKWYEEIKNFILTP
jgi:deoxyadenosine/deoxycytidine kinase